MKKSLMYESEKKQSNWNSFGDSTSSHKTLGFKQYRADSICVYMPYLRFDLTENGIWLTSRDSLLQDIYIYIYDSKTPYIFDAMRRKRTNVQPLRWGKTIFYFLTIFCLFGWLCERTYQIFHEYLSNPTYTETAILPQFHADVPSVSICPLYNGYKKDVLGVSL